MKVIFLKDVRNVARRHDIKDVNDGYARNFLFPNELAKPATADVLKEAENLKSKANIEAKEFDKHVAELKRVLADRSLEFFIKADKSGAVFGSVNKEAILSALRDTKLIGKEHVEIDLERPIKELGEKKIKIRFKNGAEGELKIIVKKS